MGQRAQDVGFYPSMAVNLRLRLDSTYNSAGKDPAGVEIDTLATTPTQGGGQAPLRPAMLGGTADKLSRLLTIVPKAASIELAGYRQAGKWNLTLLYKDLPLDPRMIRAIGVEIYAGAVSAANFQTGLFEQVKPGQPRKSVVDTAAKNGLLNPDNLVLVGVADEDGITLGRGNLIHIEGRDLRGVLLDAKVRPENLAKIDLSQNIVQVVVDIIATHPLMGAVRVDFMGSDWPNGIPSPGVVGDLTKVNTVMTTASGSATSGARPAGGAGQSWTLWDAITKYCYLVGAIPYFIGETLWVRRAFSLYDYQLNPNHLPSVPVPFANGQPRPALPHPNYRCMVYGRNILTLEMKRKLGGTAKTPVVEVVCTDTSSKTRGMNRLLVARWPPTPDATSVSPSGDSALTDIMRIPVYGISSQTRLEEIAHQVWEEVARGEITGSVETKDLCSFAGNNDDADIIRMRPGDPVEIVVNAENPIDEYPIVGDAGAWEVAAATQVQMLTEKIGDKALAQAIVDTRSGKIAELQRTFRVNSVHFAWDANVGIAVDFTFNNYIEPRFAQGKIAPATTTAPKQQSITFNTGSTVVASPPTPALPKPTEIFAPDPKKAAAGNFLANQALIQGLLK